MDLINSLSRRSEGSSSEINVDCILRRLRIVPHNVTAVNVPSAQTVCSFAKCVNNGHILASGNECGSVIIQNTRPDSKMSQETHVHRHSVFSVAWSDVEMNIATGSGDHRVGLWSVLGSGHLQMVRCFKGHVGSVKSVVFQPQSSDVIASCGRDGNVNVFDSRNSAQIPDISIKKAHSYRYVKHYPNLLPTHGISGHVTSVAFLNGFYLLSCCDIDPVIAVWDLRRTSYASNRTFPVPAFELNTTARRDRKSPVSGNIDMVLNSAKTMVYAYSTHSSINGFNLAKWFPAPVCYYKGHRGKNFHLKCAISPNDRYLCCTDDDEKIFIWKTQKSGICNPMLKLSSTYEGVSGVDWDRSGDVKIAVCTDYHSPIIWSPRDSWKTKSPNNEMFDMVKQFASNCRVTEYEDGRIPEKRKRLLPDFQKDSSPKSNVSDKSVGDMLKDLPDSVKSGRFCQYHRCVKVRYSQEKRKVNWLTKLSAKKCKLEKIPIDVDGQKLAVQLPSTNKATNEGSDPSSS